MELCNLKTIRELLLRYSLSPKKIFGQNFLTNAAVVRRIAAASYYGGDQGFDAAFPDEPHGNVLEIGPGIGALTSELCGYYGNVAAVEIDRELIALLFETLSQHDNVSVINEDFMKLELCSFINELFGGERVDVCANLPYYITSPIIMKLLETFPASKLSPVSQITIMIQSEVADRLCAQPGDDAYGAITASVALHATASRLFTVSAGNFYPAPKVSSAIVQLKTYENGIYSVFPELCDMKLTDSECDAFAAKVKKIIAAAFEQRRKTLTNALSGDYDKQKVISALDTMSLRSDIRGERLSAYDFCRLAALL